MSLRSLIILAASIEEGLATSTPVNRGTSEGLDTSILEQPAGSYSTLNKVVTHNLSLMREMGDGTMSTLISNESMGGNAGSFEGYSCVGTAFCYDRQGKIHYFDNIQHIPKELKHLPMGIFKVQLKKDGCKIVGVTYETHNPNTNEKTIPTGTAITNIGNTINFYNAMEKTASKP